MTKFFISYSRKDKAFAERLNNALRELELDSWIDWIDIPPTADWWDQIQKGIESADAFLVLLSPDSIASKVFRQEIDHAIMNGKRLIPLVVRDIKPEDVHEALTKLNWIFFRESDDFETSLGKLEVMFMMTKRTKPRIDAMRMNMNFLTVRQGWANARTKAVAAR